MTLEKMLADIGDQLRREREKGGLTQRELARRLGVSQVTISANENGSRLAPRTLKKHAEFLGFKITISMTPWEGPNP